MQRTKRKETKRLTLIHKTLHIYCFLKKKMIFISNIVDAKIKAERKV